MKFFIDTADLEEIREALSWGVLSSVTTNPSLYAKTSGKLSVFLYASLSPVTPRQAGLTVTEADEVLLPRLLIDDGRILSDNLRESGHDRKWLEEELRRRNLSSPAQVFLFTVDAGGNTICVPREVGR